MSSSNTMLRIVFLQKIARLLLYAESLDIQLLCYSYIRTTEQQKIFYAEGKSNCDGVKLKSKHQLSRAMDFVIVKNEVPIWERIPEYDILGKYWKDIGGAWGGDWESLNDIYHFQI